MRNNTHFSYKVT